MYDLISEKTVLVSLTRLSGDSLLGFYLSCKEIESSDVLGLGDFVDYSTRIRKKCHVYLFLNYFRCNNL